MMTYLYLLFFSLFYLSSSQTTTISLSPTAVSWPLETNLWQKIRHLADVSSTRAYNLKHPQTSATTTTTSSGSVANVPLFPRGFGGYSISLAFGTPPQNLSFIMDTGSSLLWFPCTQRYSCSSCNFSGSDPDHVPLFIPRSSSSSRIVGCRNPKCKWIFPAVQCKECDNNATSCDKLCPPYIIQYGSGSTTGLLLSESLILPGRTVENFVAGCSVFSTRQPAGIAGFGRGPESLPAQMGLKRFSYCLPSHSFDDTPVSSDLVLTDAGGGGAKTGETQYTPFRRNPPTSNTAFRNYYYVTLREIAVGGVNVKAPHEFLVPDGAGNGGTIVDSGTTFTYMEKGVFELVEREFDRQVGRNYSRATEVEKVAGLRPCFNVSGESTIFLPRLAFHFKGGAKMNLALSDYFSFVEESVICMTMVTNEGALGGVGQGPAIILGNYQQQNLYMEYDLENDRLGFKRQSCE